MIALMYTIVACRYKGSREISNSDKYVITSDGDTYTLEIRDVFGEDQDEYQVKATNRGGTKTSRADLVISCMYQYYRV